MAWRNRLATRPHALDAAVFLGVLAVYLITTSWNYPLHIDTSASSMACA